jgi:dTDP-glucose pyrophosphorylase
MMSTVAVSKGGERRTTSAIQRLLTLGSQVGVEKYDGPWFDFGSREMIEIAEQWFRI